MSFNSGPITDCEARMQQEYAELARLWAEVREGWRDEKSRQFEQRHLQPLGPCLGRLTASLQEFVQTIRKADRELQDDSRWERN